MRSIWDVCKCSSRRLFPSKSSLSRLSRPPLVFFFLLFVNLLRFLPAIALGSGRGGRGVIQRVGFGWRLFGRRVAASRIIVVLFVIPEGSQLVRYGHYLSSLRY